RADVRRRVGVGRLHAGDARGLALHHRLAAVQHLADERLLQRALQLLELGDVHRRDRPEHHEQAHQERDHVGVREQPALVSAVVVAAAPLAPAHAASFSGSGSPAAGAAPPPEDCLPRFFGGTKLSSFSASTRGLSPAWIERIASSTIVRWLTSSADISFSLLAIGRKMMFALPTPYSVARNAPAMCGPSLDGSSRCESTTTRPMTVPRMPIVG